MNNKKIRVLIIAILTLIFTVSCTMGTSNITEIEIVNIQTGEKQIVQKDSDTSKYILDAINKKQKTDENTQDLTAYEIIIKENTKNDTYIMKFDVKNQKVYISKDNNNYIVKENISENLLTSESFSYAYISDTIQMGKLYHNSEQIIPDLEYQWSYKDINSTYQHKMGTIQSSDEKFKMSAQDTVELVFTNQPDMQIVKTYYKGDVVSTTKNIAEAVKSIKKDGEYYFEVEVKWNEKQDKNYYGSQVISFVAEVDNPADVTVISRENFPGNILIVGIDNLNADETAEINADFVKTKVEVYQYGDTHMVIMPIDLYAQTGEHEIEVKFNSTKDNEYITTKPVMINNKDFKTQYLVISEEIADATNNDKSDAEFVEFVKAARSKSGEEKLWQGEFIMPIEGRLTTDFAEIRYVNNDISSSRHSGIDLAAGTGTQIKAANSGKVVLAMGLLSPGNTVVIDHGMGLFTSYYHLDTFGVEEGDVVNKGDIIGTVGTTGFSTGPHLHYAVSIYNAYVNPYQPLTGIFD